ncbi:exported hypothetical protein [Desulfosarcina cetonica]|nr:exported hypothetical protein [Desulfosarcina cetonica]
MRNAMNRWLAMLLGVVFFLGPAPVGCQAAAPTGQATLQQLTNWLATHRGKASGLPLSHVGDKRFTNWCFTYDAAVTALAWVALKRTDEARRIIDFYISTAHAHRLGGIIEAVSAVPPYDGKDWSVRSGANLWLGLAAYRLYKATAEPRYLAFATRLGDFARGLQQNGGIRLGPSGDPASAVDQHFGYDPAMPAYADVFSTEATIDAFALFHQLQSEPKGKRFRQAAEACLDWLRRVAWNPVDKRFNRGFQRSPDYSVASDVQAWGISALGLSRLDNIEKGAAEGMIRFVVAHCQSRVAYTRPDGITVQVVGIDFVDHGARAELKRPPLVSPEWTFQLANAYLRLADDFTRRGNTEKAQHYTRQREMLIDGIMAMATIRNNAAGLPYASLDDAAIGHENRTPAKGNLSTIGVAYGILALTGYDPLRAAGE